MTIELSEDYTPSIDEEYMSTTQVEYFRQKLLKSYNYLRSVEIKIMG